MALIFFVEISELLKISRKQVDKTAFLNDSNCHWQSICSEEIVHRASFLTADCVFFDFLRYVCDQPFFSGIVVLL